MGNHLRIDGKLDAQRPDQEYADLGRMLWSLKEDGSVTFEDTAMGGGPYAPVRKVFAGFTMDDVWKFSNIEVTGHGRLVAQSARPAIEINVASIDLTVLLSAVDKEIESADAPDEVKAEAHTKVRAALDAVESVGTSATGELLGAALRHVLGL